MSNSDLLRRLALIAAWLLAVVLTNLTVPAAGLMCLGILLLGGLLLLEAFGPRRVYPTEPPAQYATRAEQPESE